MSDDAGWRILQSSMLRAVAYDAGSGDLRVRFAGGTQYRYHDVPQEVFDALLDPPGGSVGRYFNDTIRDGYDYDEEPRRP
jgi:lysyl-tRNA synthetase, class II